MNHLLASNSLYLRKHAHNPIDWWYWCSEALDLAKQQDKPIFLSIGYSSCHWCTVMEGEAFSDPEIASYLNKNYIAIKVDREERPDLDSIYMQALQLMIGQGGWPLNIFLTPDHLIPFYGGTYFPVEPRYGRSGFLQVLHSIHRFYHQEKAKLSELTTEIFNTIQASTQLPTLDLQALNQQVLFQGIEENTAIVQPSDFGQPSFPMIPYATLALQGSRYQFSSRYNGYQLAQQRGLELALGGIFDHVAGGFHRYTVDATWTVPHFEKMLYDNGQIVEYLANLWSSGYTEPALETAIIETVRWLSREMVDQQGYFYSSQDADNFTHPDHNEAEEGAFYVWSFAELEQELSPEELLSLQSYFKITPRGNFEGKNVLQRTLKTELSPLTLSALEKLFEKRYGLPKNKLETFPIAKDNQSAKNQQWLGRIPPVTDTKMILSWNSLMISGLARVSSVFQNGDYYEIAEKAVNFIIRNQFIDGRLHRLYYEGKTTGYAQSEDYAFFIKALLDLHQTQPIDTLWLDYAIQIQQEFDHYLWSQETGGYLNASPEILGELIITERSYFDNATPSPNGIAIQNLIRLFLLTNNSLYLDKAEQTLSSFGYILEKSPRSCPSLFIALDWYKRSFSITVKNKSLFQKLTSQYHPTAIFTLSDNIPPSALALVCQGLHCLSPAESEEQLYQQLNNY